MKQYLIILIIGVVCSVSYGQNVIDGSFIPSDIRAGKLEVFKRTDGGVKVTLRKRGTSKATIFVCKQLDKQENTYEGEIAYEKRSFERNESILHLKYNASENFIDLYMLDNDRIVTTHILYARDKKTLKSKMKKFKLLSKFKQNLAALSESKKEFSPMVGKLIPSDEPSKLSKGRAGQVIFFSEKPEIGKEDPNKIKTHFKVGEPVWAIAYLPKPYGEMRDLYQEYYDEKERKKRYFVGIAMFKNDRGMVGEEGRLFSMAAVREINKDDLKNNYIIFQVIPTLNENKMNDNGASWVSERISKLLDNKVQKLKIGLNTKSYAKRKDLTISGAFTLDLSQGTGDFDKIAKGINKKQFDAKELPKARKKDASLEAKLKEAVKDHAYGDSYYADTNWKNVIITSKDWDVLKTRRSDELYFRIEGLYLDGVITFTGRNGGDCGYMEFRFIKKYMGGGRYSNTVKVYGGGDSIHITHVNCDKVK
ncbi:protein of unknown function [Tenacibaculum sp. 190524A02b]|uniref:hypothetical protein n=1 Tax=Tenacibaculum vairaonense TaxID=3137860 RepID=UPI0032B0F513